MLMRSLTTDRCPECSCSEVCCERRGGQHVNGMWFETREFTCGCIIAFIPNFETEQINRKCNQSSRAKQVQAQRAEMIKKLHETIESNLTEDSEFNDRVRRTLSYLS